MAAGEDGGFEEMGGEACGGAKSVRHTSHWEGRFPMLNLWIGLEAWVSCLGDEDLAMRWLLILQVIVRYGVRLVISPTMVVAN